LPTASLLGFIVFQSNENQVNEMKEVAYPKYRWFVLAAMTVVSIANVILFFSVAILIEPMSKTMGLSLGETSGLVMGVPNLVMAISTMVSGALVDRFGVNRTWIAGIAMQIVASLLVPVFGGSYLGMAVIRLLQGLGAGPLMAAGALLVAQWFPIKERGIVMGLGSASVPAALAIGFAFVPLALQKTGSWQTAMAWVSIFSFIALGLWLVVVAGPNPPVVEREAFSGQPGSSSNEFKKALLMPATWSAVLCVFWFCWQFQAFTSLTPNYLAMHRPFGIGMGTMKAGTLMAAVQMLVLAGSILGGVITLKVFRGQPRPLVMISFFVSAVLYYAISFQAVNSVTPLLTVFLLLTGFALSTINPHVFTFIANNYPQAIIGKLGGMVMGVGVFGGVAGIAVGSYALHLTGFYQLTITITGAVGLIGFLTSVCLKAERPSAVKTDAA
jgi:MFS family permease